MQIHTKDTYQEPDETKLSKKLFENEPFMVHFNAIRILFQNSKKNFQIRYSCVRKDLLDNASKFN